MLSSDAERDDHFISIDHTLPIYNEDDILSEDYEQTLLSRDFDQSHSLDYDDEPLSEDFDHTMLEDDNQNQFEAANDTSGDEGDSQSMSEEEDDLEYEDDLSLADLTAGEIRKLTFEKVEDAENFYTRYSRANGFSIRKRDGIRKGSMWYMRKWVCSRAGKRKIYLSTTKIGKRSSRPLTRCLCRAHFRVVLHKGSNRWRVTSFNEIHTHKTVSAGYAHLLRNHRKVSPVDMAQINAMLSVGIRPCHIFKLMMLQNGGTRKLPFLAKDMYNAISKARSGAIENGDVMTTFAYFDVKKERDPGFEYQYTLLEGYVLGNLFWCDSRSKIDYDSFGDLVMFDSTFGTNIYGRSLVLFLGINHHHQTCIFGSGLLNGETLQNYEWLLQQFLAAMSHKVPQSVMTDSDNAMRSAISRVFPKIPHRLCSWHLMRNARSNIPKETFSNNFFNCMIAEDEVIFERRWKKMITKFKVHKHHWILKMYRTKNMWSCANLKGAFFAGQHANSRCESLNFVTKCYINKKNNFYELVRHYESALEHVRHNETMSEYSNMTSKAISNQLLKSIDDSAAEVYTLESLSEFRKELAMESMTKVLPETTTCGMTTRYVCGIAYRPEIRFVVHFNGRDNSAICDCKKYESTGFICSHIIHILKYRDIKKLPETCILPRWTKKAKQPHNDVESITYSDEALLMTRQGMLNMVCDELCKYAARSSDGFSRVRAEIASLTLWAKELDKPPVPVAAHNAEPLHDPPRTQTRQTEEELGSKPKRQKRKCSVCRSEKHAKPKCPKWLKSLTQNYTDQEESEDLRTDNLQPLQTPFNFASYGGTSQSQSIVSQPTTTSNNASNR